MDQTLVKKLLSFGRDDGMLKTAVPGVRCLKRSATDKLSKRLWGSCFAIVAQGCKEVKLGSETYRGEASHFTITPMDLHVVSRFAKASVEKPFLGILIDFDFKTVREIALQIKNQSDVDAQQSGPLFLGKVNNSVSECALRLVNLFDASDDGPVLGPLVIRELIYHFLKSPEGSGLLRYVRSGTKMHKILDVIHKLKDDLSVEVDVQQLARESRMNRSDFFKHFKAATTLSPIQYQKHLRLVEAKRLLIEESETAEGAAFRVGYRSASQFSREYHRFYGNTPLKDRQHVVL